jgi:hypothetical protein
MASRRCTPEWLIAEAARLAACAWSDDRARAEAIGHLCNAAVRLREVSARRAAERDREATIADAAERAMRLLGEYVGGDGSGAMRQ